MFATIAIRLLNNAQLFFLLTVAAFSKHYILPGVSIADMVAAIYILILGINYINNGSLILPKSTISLSLLISWGLISYFFLTNFFLTPFNYDEFIKSSLKWIFYLLFFITIYSYFVKIKREVLEESLLDGLVLHSFIAIYIFLILQFNLNLPYEFFWEGQDVTISTAYFGGEIVRARGVFTEPAGLGFFLNLGLAFIAFSTRKDFKLCWKKLIVIISILLTFSLVSYFLLGLIISLLLIDKRKSIIKNINFVGPVLFLVVSLFLISGLFSSFNKTVVNRLDQISKGKDGSATERLLGSWEYALSIAQNSPFLGSGIGNSTEVYSLYRPRLVFKHLDNGNITNVFAGILAESGLVGLALFTSVLIFVYFKNKKLALIMVAGCFATGSYLTITFWLYLSLYHLPTTTIRLIPKSLLIKA